MKKIIALPRGSILIVLCLLFPLYGGLVYGASGTWTANANGNWSTTTNWSGGTVASGSGFNANFNTLNITADRTVTLDAPYTITNILFADATTASNNWILAGPSLLTLAGTPVITVTNQTATISPVITGTVGLTKAGAGILILSGANSYTGTTTISAGTLRAGASATVFGANAALVANNTAGVILDCNNYNVSIGSLATGGPNGGNVTLGSGTLTLGGNNTSTSYAGVISGSGNIVKVGTGIQTFTRANTYTGTTTVTQGTLAAGVATNSFGSNSAVIFDNTPGATLNITGFNTTAGSLAGGGSSGGNITLGTAFLTTGGNNSSTSYGGAISGTGGIIKTGSGTQTLSGLNVYTGTTTVNAGILKAGSSPTAFGTNSALSLADVAGASIDISGYNTSIGSIAGGGVTGGNVTLGSATLTAGGNNTSTTYSGVISGTGGIIKTGSGTLTFTGSHTYTGITTINGGILVAPVLAAAESASSIGAADADPGNLLLSNGTLRYSGGTVSTNRGFTLQSGTNTIDISTSGAVVTLSGLATGSGNLIKSGVGVLSLSGANNNSGTITVNAGILRAGSSGTPFGTLPLVSLSNTSGAYLDLADNNVTIGTLSGSGTNGGWVTLGSGILTTGGNNGSAVYAGTLSGTGGITKEGTGSLTLSRANTYTGPTTINAGSLVAGVATTSLGVNSAVTLANASGALLSLATFATTIGSLAGGGALGGNVNLGTVILTTGGNGTSTSYSGVISGTGGITKLGAGVQTLSGANTYTGATTISGGILKAGATTSSFGTNSALTFGTTAGTAIDITGYPTTVGSITGGNATGGNIILGDAVLTVGTNNTSPAAYAGIISGTGGITKTGTGTLLLSGTNTFTGITTFSGGTISVGALSNGGFASPLGQAAATPDRLVFNGGGLLYSGGTAAINRGLTIGSGGGTVTVSTTATVLTASGEITGSGQLTKAGTGVLVLSGANSFTGTATVLAGTLRAGSAAAPGVNSAVTIANATSTIFDCANYSLTIGALSGGGATGGTITLGSGTLTLGNNNADGSFDGLISGTGGVIKAGSGIQTMSRASTFTGPFTLVNGTISIPTVANGGVASPIGQSSNAASNLVFNGGTLSYSGATASTDRNFTLSAGGGTFAVASSSATLTLGGAGSGAGGLTKAGAGVLIPSASNTYTGPVRLSGGVLSIASLANGGIAGRLGQSSSAAGNLVFDGGTLRYTGASAGSDRNFTLSAGGGSIEVTGAGTSMTLSGAGTGSGGLTKTGPGTLVFPGAHTYTGPTSISAGTLLLNGSIAASTTAVASGALLTGTGSCGGPTTINGTLSPGNSGIGTLTINNTLAIGPAGIVLIDLSKSGTVLQNDSVKGISSLQCQGTLTVSLSGTALASGDAFAIFSATSFSGAFSTITLPALDAGLVWHTTDLYTAGIISVRQTQTITFGALADKIISQPDFNLSATASSTLPVTYASSDPSVATVSGSTVHLAGTGTTTITATQSGNAYFTSAPPVNQSLVVDSNHVPAPFTLIAPLADIEGTATPVLQWNASTDTDPTDPVLTYIAEIAADSLFTVDKIRYAGLTATDFTVPSGALGGHARYFWRVFAKDNWPDSTVSSGYGVFRTVNTMPQAVTLLTPAAAAEVDHTPLFSWSPTNDIDPSDSLYSYLLLIAEDSLFSAGKLSIALTALESYRITSSGQLDGNRRYYWKVFAKSNSLDSVTSAIRSFFVANTAPAAVTLLSPAAGSDVPLTPTFDWSDGSDADITDAGRIIYTFEISTDRSFSPLFLRRQNLTSSRYVAAAGDNLVDNTHYFWRVWTTDSYPDSTASIERSCFVNAFNQAPNLSTPLAPPDSIERSPDDSLTWTRRDADPGDSLLYDIRISRDVSFTQILAGKTGYSGTRIAMRELDGYDQMPDNRYYYWQVDAIDPSGMRSGFTSGRNVFALNKTNDTPFVPLRLLPSTEGSLGVDNRLYWVSRDADSIGKSADTRTMSVLVDDDPGFESPLGMITGIASDSVTVKTLDDSLRLIDNTRYYWQVAATDNHGVRGSFAKSAAPFWFNSTNNPPGAPVLRSPQDGADMGPLDSICWFASLDPDPNDSVIYVLQISPAADFSDTLSVDTLSGTGIRLNQLDMYSHLRTGVSYYLRLYSIDNVRAASPFAGGGATKIVFGSTPPVLPSAYSPADDSVLYPTESLRWRAGSDGDAGPHDRLLYLIEISPLANFSIVAVNDTVTDTTTIIGDLAGANALGDNARYYWRLRTGDNHGAVSNYSPVHRFYLDKSNLPPTTPLAVSPPDSSVIRPGAVFSWRSGSDPDPGNRITYRLIAASVRDFSDTVLIISGITDTMVALDTLRARNSAYRPDSLMQDTAGFSDNRFYFWTVLSVDNHNAFSPPSVPRVVYINLVNDTPAVPVDLTPAFGRMIFPSEKLRWIDPSIIEFLDPVRFIVELATDSLFTIALLSDTIDTGKAVRIDSLDGISKIAAEQYLFWRVAGIDKMGVRGRFSLPASIYYSLRNDAPEAITDVLPTDIKTTLTPIDRLSWSPVSDQNSDSVYYDLRISMSPFDTAAADSSIFLTVADIETPGIKLNNIGARYSLLTTEQSYYFRVRARDEHHASSRWSSSGAFLFRSTPPGDPAVSNSGNITLGIFDTLVWESALDPDAGTYDTLRYIIHLSSEESFANISGSATVSGRAILPLMALPTVDSLTDDLSYYWHVRAVDPHGAVSDWSETSRFTFNRTNSAPRRVFIQTLSSQKISALRPFSTIRWSCSDPENDTMLYRIELARDSLFLYGTASLPGISATALRIDAIPHYATRLHADSIYWVRIRAADVKGASGAWSAACAFRFDAVDNVASAPVVLFPGRNGYAVGSDSILWINSFDEEDSVIRYQVTIHADTADAPVAFADSVTMLTGAVTGLPLFELSGYTTLSRNTFYWIRVNPASLVDTLWISGRGSGWQSFFFGDQRIVLPGEACHVSIIIPGDSSSSVARSADSSVAVQFSASSFSAPTAVRITALPAGGDTSLGADSASVRLFSLINKANNYAAGDRSMWPVNEPAFSIETFSLSDSIAPGKLLDTVMLYIAYHDKDNDGYVDGDSRIPDSVLHVFHLDETTGRWSPVPLAKNRGNAMSTNLARRAAAPDSAASCKAVAITHFSIYGIMAYRKFSEPFGQFKVYPSPFMLGKGDKNVSISYRLGEDASIDMVVFSMDGGVVFRQHIVMGDPAYGTATEAEIRFPWNGRNMAGRLVGNGMYLVKVRATSRSGKHYNVQQYIGVVR